MHPDAQEPYKMEGRPHDPYWIIDVVGRDNTQQVDDIQNDVREFTTGLRIKFPKHYHGEIYEHPNLWKTGYMLSGGPRILSPHDAEEEIMIPLYKYKDGDDLALPMPVAILVMRESQYTTTSLIKAQPASAAAAAYGYAANARPTQLSFDDPAPHRQTKSRNRVKSSSSGKASTNHFS
jgi:hypothetical protein